MEPRITIITLGVRDLDNSVRFYRDGLGLPVRDQYPEAVFFRMGGVSLERNATHSAINPVDSYSRRY